MTGSRLDGRVALVSGVGPGLGLASARTLAAHGATVVIVARDESRLEACQETLRQSVRGATVHRYTADISCPGEARRLVRSSLDRCGTIDILVNNACRNPAVTSLLDDDLSEWRLAMDVNFFGSLQLTQHVARAMIEGGSGSLIFVSSMATREVTDRHMPYAASKAALMMAMRGIARELGPHGIRANAVVPGYIDTERIRAKTDRAELERRAVLGFVPTPEQVAETVLYLASDMSSPVTGVAIDVNAGMWVSG